MTNDDALEGQVALVTGAARGIGAAAARALALRGAHVWLTDVLDCETAVQSIDADGGSATSRELDVRDADACSAVVDAIIEVHGRLDIAVLNAGICPPGGVVGDAAQWRKVMDVNVEGTRHCVAAAWDRLCERGGRIVIVSSMAYYQGGRIVGTEYTTSKAALVGMTRHLARNGAAHGVIVNAVAPGIIDTEMTREFDKPDPADIPLGRYGTAADVAGPISFLCGPESAYMTGTVLNITGGMILAA